MDKKDFLDVTALDVVEESIWKYDSSILRRLLQDTMGQETCREGAEQE